VIAHIVLFTPKATLSDSSKRLFAQSVVKTLSAIEHVTAAKVGRRVDVDPGYGRHLGDSTYEFAAIIEFESRSALVDYLVDPRHQELGRLFWESCDRTVVSEVEYVDLASRNAVDELVR
jgi:hypothetical protein